MLSSPPLFRVIAMILVTGGAGFIGANFVLDWLAASAASRWSISTSSPTRATCGNLAPLAGDARHVFVRGDIGDAEARRRAARAAPAARDRQFRRRNARRPLDSRAGGVHRHERRRHVRAARMRPRDGGARCRRTSASAFRFLHVSTDEVYGSLGPDDPPFSRNDAVRAEQPVFRVEGGVGSPRARLSPHVRPADAHDELLEQLRPAAVSGEAHSADDRQRARAASRCPSTATAATCATGSTSAIIAARFARCSTRGRPGETYNVGGDAEMANIDVVHTLCRPRRRAQPGSDLPAARHVRRRPAGTRPPLRDRRDEDPARARLVAGGDVRVGHAQDRRLVSRRTATGSRACRTPSTGNGSTCNTRARCDVPARS